MGRELWFSGIDQWIEELILSWSFLVVFINSRSLNVFERCSYEQSIRMLLQRS
jgi:hypothetical protein